MCPRNRMYQTFFLRCHNYISFRTTFMNELRNIYSSLASRIANDTLTVKLYGDKDSNPAPTKEQ